MSFPHGQVAANRKLGSMAAISQTYALLFPLSTSLRSRNLPQHRSRPSRLGPSRQVTTGEQQLRTSITCSASTSSNLPAAGAIRQKHNNIRRRSFNQLVPKAVPEPTEDSSSSPSSSQRPNFGGSPPPLPVSITSKNSSNGTSSDACLEATTSTTTSTTSRSAAVTTGSSSSSRSAAVTTGSSSRSPMSLPKPGPDEEAAVQYVTLPGEEQLPAQDQPSSGAGAGAGMPTPLHHSRHPRPTTPWRWKGAKLLGAGAAVSSGLALRYLLDVPEGLTQQAWSLTSLFLGTLVGLILEPLPVGACALVSLTTALVTHTLSWQQGLAAVDNEVVWLIVVSFFLAKGFQQTGLGERLANLLVSRFGSSSLGLALSLVLAEGVVAPAMPSTTARAAGIFMPVITSVAEEAGSYPVSGSRGRLGSFLTQVQFQSSAHSSSMFLTAAAQNLLCLQLAAGVGAAVEQPFVTWVVGAAVPGLIGVLGTPLLVYWLSPPELTSTPEAPAAAAQRLRAMGAMGQDEIIMLGAVTLAVLLWALGGQLGVSPVVAALLAICLLLLTGVLSWQDCLGYTPAWDTLIWFSVLISYSQALQENGVVQLFSSSLANQLSGLGLPWLPLFAALHVLYFVIHYMFASQTAHVGALYPVFCSLLISAGIPPQLAAMSLAYNSNLFGGITHYASGQAAVYYGSGFMRLQDVFSVGAACGAFGLLVWGGAGMVWWKVLGWY